MVGSFVTWKLVTFENIDYVLINELLGQYANLKQLFTKML